MHSIQLIGMFQCNGLVGYMMSNFTQKEANEISKLIFILQMVKKTTRQLHVGRGLMLVDWATTTTKKLR